MIATHCTIINTVVMHTKVCTELGYFDNKRLFDLALRSHAILIWDNGGNVGIVTRAQLKEMSRLYTLNSEMEHHKKKHVPSVFWDDCEHASGKLGLLLLGKEHELEYHKNESDDQANS